MHVIKNAAWPAPAAKPWPTIRPGRHPHHLAGSHRVLHHLSRSSI